MGGRQTYAGQCHCGAVKFEMTSDLAELGDCNCSRCRRLGWVMQSVPVADFTLLSGEAKLKLYHFNTHHIDHLFCTECGVESFSRGKDANGGEVVVVNVNCLENAPPVDRNTIRHWDGKSW
jgi:hypothetical protein